MSLTKEEREEGEDGGADMLIKRGGSVFNFESSVKSVYFTRGRNIKLTANPKC